MKVIPLVGALALLSGLLAACSGPVPAGRTSPTISTSSTISTRHDVNSVPGSPSLAKPSLTSSKPPRPPRWVADQGVLKGRRLYVFVEPADGFPGSARLRVSTPFTKRFVTIGPRLPRGFYPDSLFVLDRRHLWFTTFWDGGGRERPYRTSDAGTTWQWTPIVSHSMAAGSTDALWFTDANHGWLTDIQPTGPGAALYATADGGRHWHIVGDTGRRDAPRSLPTIGPVEFQPDNTMAWDAAPAYYSTTALYVTRNGGANWQLALSGQHRAFTAPGVFGTTEVEPVSWCARHTTEARLVVSTDGGVHWTSRPTVGMGAVPASDYGGPDCQPIAATEATANVTWAVAVTRGNRVVVKTTCDQGRRWHTARPPRLRVEDIGEISATGCRRALLDVRNLRGIARLYLTTDGGITWRSINRRATS